jgi:hypothetical protein
VHVAKKVALDIPVASSIPAKGEELAHKVFQARWAKAKARKQNP